MSSARSCHQARVALAVGGCLAASLVVGAPAAGAAPVPTARPAVTPAARPVGVPRTTTSTTFTASRSRPRACFRERVSGTGVDAVDIRVPATGFVRVRLEPADGAPADGDWDVAVFDDATGRLLTASAAPRSHEVADAAVTAGQQLRVQGCRYAGRASAVRVSTSFVVGPGAGAGGTAQLVVVPGPAALVGRRLADLGLDPEVGSTDGPGQGSEVVLHGPADVARLRSSGLPYRVEVGDLAADVARARRADAAYAAATRRSALPSGRTNYRHLWDYDYEMKELARRHPSLVRSVVLDVRSHEGRDISGVEITQHVRRSGDGKPVFLNAGLIHAREWPSGELPLEWAYDLVQGYGHDRRTTRLVRAVRSLVVPVVNPDGFTASREDPDQTGSIGYDDRRKSCDPAGAPSGSGQSAVCLAQASDVGVDLNRNFGAWWGGPGASTDWSDETYRGSGPFSEPEARALRDLVSTRQVTNMIMNHTAAGLVLRPPGVFAEGTPVDEPLLKALGGRVAEHDGYPSIPVYGLTDATGGSDEWAYWVGGTLALTIEIGTPGFHPAFSDVVAQYLGRAPAAGAGKGGNRGSYLAMLASTARAHEHAQLVGRAPKGWTLRLRKTVVTPTSPVQAADGSTGRPRLVRDSFTSRLVGTGGRFRWEVNPSTRPYVAGRYGRAPVAPDQPTTTLVNPPGEAPPGNEQGTNGPHEEATFTVEKAPQADVGTATVRIAWSDPDTFWYADVERPDGSYVSQTSGGDATSLTITLHDPEPGPYVVKVVNGAQVEGAPFDDWSGQVTYAGPTPAVPGTTEAWTLTCRRPDDSVAAKRQVTVGRGESVDVGRVCRAG